VAYWPIMLELKDKPCLVVGGGKVGQRKVLSLLEAEADVIVVSPEITSVLAHLEREGRIQHVTSYYHPSQLERMTLVFAATNHRETNFQVAKDAVERGIWVNVADRPELCTFTVPASISRGDLKISISTGGKSPALAARIRAGLETSFGKEYGELLTILGLIRRRVLSENGPPDDNTMLFRGLVSTNMLENIRLENWVAVEQQIMSLLGPDYSLASLGFIPGRVGQS
jgi:precorrin-2 dehydrogenase / sirohydrochlorin ferrochelatase